jgi:hypothetical protein
VDLSTSKGAYDMSSPLQKRDYFEIHDGLPAMGLQLSRDFHHMDACFRDGKPHPWPPITPIGKDELLRHEKVDTHRTRLIYGLDLPRALLERKYFSQIIALMKELHNVTPLKLGIDPFSQEWGDTMVKYTHTPPRAEDGKKYDVNAQFAEISPIAEWVVEYLYECDVRNGDPFAIQNYVARRRLLHRDMFPLLIHMTIVYWGIFWTSGNVLTTFFNMCRNICHRYAAYEFQCTIHGCPCSPSLFLKDVKPTIYGDDSLACSTPLLCSDEEMRETLLLLTGITYIEDKDETREKIGKLFLKRGCLYADGLYLAPLCSESLLNCLNWVTDSMPLLEATRINCDTAAREWAQYGKYRYDLEIAKLNRALTSVGLPPVRATWFDQVRRNH